MQTGKILTAPARFARLWLWALLAALVVPCADAGAAGVASFFDTRPTESWAAWAAGVLLVLVVGGTRHAVRSVKHPKAFLLLRGLAAVLLGLPFAGVLHGQWEFSTGSAPHVSYDEIRWGIVLYVAICDAVLILSAFRRIAAIAAAFFAALGLVACAHVSQALNLPSEAVWGQTLGMVGFLAAVGACVPLLLLKLKLPGYSSRELWEGRLKERKLWLAALLSVVPGLGYWYAMPARHQQGRLLAFLSAAAAAYILFVPLWRRVLFYGSRAAGIGPWLFFLCYALQVAAGLCLAIARITGKRRLS